MGVGVVGRRPGATKVTVSRGSAGDQPVHGKCGWNAREEREGRGARGAGRRADMQACARGAGRLTDVQACARGARACAGVRAAGAGGSLFTQE
ncbi:hypothetical protein CRG98_012486 [Punica granatum]|uniref:Uncharacterized protein n=1 Tax=Punica granatum TaxID=22663 RepID=A0A2I0KFZ9_PUNGR|nr:hypothetical protein CRG98_012486 [Punica granatum]